MEFSEKQLQTSGTIKKSENEYYQCKSRRKLHMMLIMTRRRNERNKGYLQWFPLPPWSCYRRLNEYCFNLEDKEEEAGKRERKIRKNKSRISSTNDSYDLSNKNSFFLGH